MNLNDSERLIITKMHQRGATMGDRIQGAEIVDSAYGGRSYKHAFRNLNELGIVDSKRGKGGGHTLTEHGVRIAVALEI